MIKKIIELIKKYEEIISYLFFGVLTTIVSLVTYYIFAKLLFNSGSQLDIQISNVLSWICAVTFAYTTNRIFVFKSKSKGKEIIKEITGFFSARVFSLLVDMGSMFVLTYYIGMDDMIAKLILQVVVTILNYVLSKLFIFKKEKQHEEN